MCCIPIGCQSTKDLREDLVEKKLEHVMHCCYQEVNILINRGQLVKVKFVLKESSYEKNYFSKTKEVIPNLTNIHGQILSGHTFVQK